MDARQATIHIIVLPYQPHSPPADPDDSVTRAGRIAYLDNEVAGQRSNSAAAIDLRYWVIPGDDASEAT